MRRRNDEESRMSDILLQEISVSNNFEQRSEIVQEIISRKSGFFEKWSLLIIIIVLVGLVCGTWFIKYPDIVVGSAILTSENAPKEIVPKQGGKLIALFARNNQVVKNGEIIGWLESNASTQEIINLSAKVNEGIQRFVNSDTLSLPALFNGPYLHLGDLQIPYQSFMSELRKYNDYLVNGFYKKKQSMLFDDIESINKIKDYTKIQKALTQKDSELARKTFEMNERLYKEKVISLEEYRQAQSKLISNQKELPQVDVNIISQESQIRDKEKDINQLTHDIVQQKAVFEQALYTLKSTIDEWLNQYTISAPSDGEVVFVLPLQQNQNIQQGKVIGFVNPPKGKYYSEVMLTQKSFGKVDSGMQVQLRFDAYPYQEVGYVQGRISYISGIAIDSGFLINVQFDNGLVTNHNKIIQFKNGLKAEAIIITKDMRLLERIYNGIVQTTNLQ